MTIKATIDEQEREFQVLNDGDGRWTHMISPAHGVRSRESLGNVPLGKMLLRLILPQHEYGGVRYEETGEVRCPEDEWILLGDDERLTGYTVVFFQGTSVQRYKILRLVRD